MHFHTRYRSCCSKLWHHVTHVTWDCILVVSVLAAMMVIMYYDVSSENFYGAFSKKRMRAIYSLKKTTHRKAASSNVDHLVDTIEDLKEVQGKADDISDNWADSVIDPESDDDEFDPMIENQNGDMLDAKVKDSVPTVVRNTVSTTTQTPGFQQMEIEINKDDSFENVLDTGEEDVEETRNNHALFETRMNDDGYKKTGTPGEDAIKFDPLVEIEDSYKGNFEDTFEKLKDTNDDKTEELLEDDFNTDEDATFEFAQDIHIAEVEDDSFEDIDETIDEDTFVMTQGEERYEIQNIKDEGQTDTDDEINGAISDTEVALENYSNRKNVGYTENDGEGSFESNSKHRKIDLNEEIENDQINIVDDDITNESNEIDTTSTTTRTTSDFTTTAEDEIPDDKPDMPTSEYSKAQGEDEVKENNVKVAIRSDITRRGKRKIVILGRTDLLDAERKCSKKLPSVIIIGVMKAGTEAFSTFLAINPQVAMSLNLRSTLFFTSNYNKGFAWYKEQMMCSSSDQVTVEKAPQYYPNALAPGRIHNMDPNIKLILIVRDPIDRAMSHFLQMKNSNPQKLKGDTFEKSVFLPDGSVRTDSPFISLSRYSVILKRWLKYFKLRQILVIDGDDFKKDQVRSLSLTEKFIGVRKYITKDKFALNKERGLYCIKTGEGKDDLECLSNGKGRSHPNIEQVKLTKLKQYFRPYNEEFYKMVGKRFNW